MTQAKAKGRPLTLREPYGTLARSMGGLGKLAEALGVAPRTIRDWSNGRTSPQGPSLILLNQHLTKRKLDPVR